MAAPKNRIERRLEKKSIVTPYGSEDVTINSNGIDQHEYCCDEYHVNIVRACVRMRVCVCVCVSVCVCVGVCGCVCV